LPVEAYHDSEAASAALGFVLTNCQSTLPDRSFVLIPISPIRQVKTLRKIPRNELEAQIIEAHAKLQPTQQCTNVSSVATLVRLGSFEIRLIQPFSVPPGGSAGFWLELFDHDRQLSIDSVGACVIEDAVIAAEEFIARATKLSENPHAWRRST
jgi:hypothetical protein